MREKIAYRFLHYLDYFFIEPTPASTMEEEGKFKRAERRLGSLFKQFGIDKNPEKGTSDTGN